MKKVLFLTANNLATNPRLLKELTLARKFYKCTVLSFQLGNWSELLDKNIRSSFQEVNFILLPAIRKPFLLWAFSTLLEKLSQILYPVFKGNLLINALANSKRSYLLNSALKKHAGEYDFVIAHNLPALYPAFCFSQKKNVPFGFDIEDFHPGEKIENDIKNERARRIFLMQKILPSASYFSYASPLIGKSVLNIAPGLEKCTKFLLNNSFSIAEFTHPLLNKTKRLKLVWFSQNINAGRGLETFLPILNEYKECVEITLIGNLNTSFYTTFLKNYSEIINFKKPLPQNLLHKQLAEFDVGLAIESNITDFNREICLTNKIFAYAQAGLYVLATNTSGQTSFIEQNPWIGALVGNEQAEIREAVKILIDKRDSIRKRSFERFGKSKDLSWENEQAKLVDIWKVLEKKEQR